MHHPLILLLCLLALPLNAADLTQIRQLIEAKHVPEAKPLLEKLLTENPADVDALLLLGQCQQEMQQLPEAIGTLSKAADLAPRRADVLLSYGAVCMQQAGAARSLGLAKKGRVSLETSLEINPSLTDARHILIGYYSNAPWFAGGDMEKAYAHAEALKKSDPDTGFVVLMSLKAKDKKFDEVFALCDEALKKSPDNYAVLYEYGRAASLSGQHGHEGLIALEKCTKLTPPPRSPSHAGVYYRMGLIYQMDKKTEDANRCFDEALRRDPDNKPFVDQVKKARNS